MNEDAERDHDFPQNEVEKKIKRLEDALAKVSGTEDKRMLWWILPLVAIIFASKYLKLSPTVVIIAIPLIVFGGLVSVIYRNIKRKKDILIKHGLKCPDCGYIPRTLNASGVFYSKKCIKCSAKLDV